MDAARSIHVVNVRWKVGRDLARHACCHYCPNNHITPPPPPPPIRVHGKKRYYPADTTFSLAKLFLPDQTTPSSTLSHMHRSKSGTPCHPPFYTNSPIFAITRALRLQRIVTYGRKTGFGPHKLMCNTFSACSSSH